MDEKLNEQGEVRIEVARRATAEDDSPDEPRRAEGYYLSLRDCYDQQLLIDFYQTQLMPGFPIQSELEPLENFLVGLKAKPSDSDFILDIILVLDGQPDERLTNRGRDVAHKNNQHVPTSGGGEHVPRVLNDCEKDQVDASLSSSLTKSDGAAPKWPSIMGGLVAEYYSPINSGLVTYVMVDRKYRGQHLASSLVEHARTLFDSRARSMGHLSGCNCVYLETNSATKISAQQDVIDPRRRHLIWWRVGCRLVDFDYVAPPLAAGMPVQDFLLLTVLITDRVPTDESGAYYVPSALLSKFIDFQWKLAESLERVDASQLALPQVRRMREQLELRERIPLLDLPWGGGREWTIIDMAEDYDLDLLVQFYRIFMLSDEEPDAEPLENWIRYLSDESQSEVHFADFHVLIALDMIEHPPRVVGGVTYFYYMHANVGLVTYLFVDNSVRGRGLGSLLIREVIDSCDANAISRGHLAGCNMTLFEVELIGGPERSHTYLYKRGLRQICFDYYCPPYSISDFSKPYLLALYVDEYVPKDDNGNHVLPSSLLRRAVCAFWQSAQDYRYLKNFEQDRHFLYVMRQLDSIGDHVLVSPDLPWHRRRANATFADDAKLGIAEPLPADPPSSSSSSSSAASSSTAVIDFVARL
jgi:GNAT superfamily N-acetyltransferase